MNKLLPINFKQFLKHTAQTPFLIDGSDLKNIHLKLKVYEYC